jgi:O-antigen/teichoic acid export membrane protein
MTQRLPGSNGPDAAREISPEALTTWARVWIVAGNGARHLVVPLVNFVVSYLVISLASAEIWGEFVVRLVVVTLTVHILAWGNHEYLLRAFSRDPGALGSLWRRSLVTRGSFLVVAVAGCVALGLRGGDLGWAVLWLAAAFGHQALTVVVLFTRRFGVAVSAEVVGLLVTTVLLLSRGPTIDVAFVVKAVVLGLIARLAVGLAAFSRVIFDGVSVVFDPRHLVEAIPFFLTGFSGLLVSKADLLVVTATLSHAEIGAYQVLVSFFIAVQSLAAIAVTPFLREFYRAPDDDDRRTAWRLLAAGVVVLVVAVPVAHLVLNRIYGLDLPLTLLVLGACYSLPVYGYLPLVYLLYKRGREREVALASFVGAAFNIVLTIVLVRPFGMVGALAAGTTAQWVLWGLIWGMQRDQKVSRSP